MSTETRHHLMPVPAGVSFEDGKLIVAPGFSAGICDTTGPRARRGIHRALARLESRVGFAVSRAWASQETATLSVCSKRPGQNVQDPDEDESYSLRVSAGRIELNAGTDVGVLRGLETLLQLLEPGSQGFHFPFVRVDDRPRFRWRGLLIDVCRHWHPVEVIKRNLDAMAAVKLNVLHWHLSENQGFRVESRVFPKLHQLGSDGLYYTQEQIREVVEYARDRGIRVLPEFDMPGHATAWFVGYPELASAPGPYAIEREFGVFAPSFDPTREKVYTFIDRFVAEMAALFPDPYWHVGGDEVDGKQWNANPAIQRFMKQHGLKDNEALQTYFNQRLLKILQKHGKRMVGWDEILHPDLPRDIVVQSWRGQESLGAGAQQGFSGILSAGYYLDHMLTAAQHYAVDPLPASSALDAPQAARVLGGEACMWAESVAPENIDSRIWPRNAAIAERLWSPREVTDPDAMYRRMAVVSRQLEELGLQHLSGPEMMLRRYAGAEPVEPLRALLAVLSPANPFARSKTQLSPLTSLPDVAVPDPPARQEIALLVNAIAQNVAGSRQATESLAKRFAEWRKLPPVLASMAERNSRFTETLAISADLAELAAAGEEALEYLGKGEPASKEWADQRLGLVKRLRETKGYVRISVARDVGRLIAAAARVPQPNPQAR